MKGAVKEAIAVASPIFNTFIKIPQAFLAISLAVTAVTASLLLVLIKVQREISTRWREIIKDPEWWERIPWVGGVAGLIIAIASLIALMLTW